jgi:hypothetical protein
MQAEETVLDRIEARKLIRFGSVMRMSEERWPVIIHPWIPPGRRKIQTDIIVLPVEEKGYSK